MLPRRSLNLIASQVTGQRVRFLVASAISFGLMIGIVAFMEETGLLPADAAYAVGIVVTVTLNFFLYRFYIFPGQEKRMLTQATQFVSSVIVFRLAELAAVTLLFRVLGVHYLVTTLLVLCVSFVSKYLFMSSVVFRRSGPGEPAPLRAEAPAPGHGPVG